MSSAWQGNRLRQARGRADAIASARQGPAARLTAAKPAAAHILANVGGELVHRRGPSRRDQWGDEDMFINKSINLELQRTLRRLLAGSIGICTACTNGVCPSTSKTIRCNNPLQPSALLAPSKALVYSWFASFEPYLLAHLSFGRVEKKRTRGARLRYE